MRKSFEQESQFNYEIFSSPEDREFLRHIADRFIQKACPNGYGAMLYLDMGARIFSHLIRARWKFLYPDEKVPDTRFIKIGREMKSSHYHGHEYREEDISIFAEKVKKVFHWDKGQYKKVVIVDEFVDTGETLSFAQKIMQEAFPQIIFDEAALTLMSDNHLNNKLIAIRPGKEEGEKMKHIVNDLLNKQGGRNAYSLPVQLGVHYQYPNDIFVKLSGEPGENISDVFGKQAEEYRQAVKELVALASSNQ